MEIPEKGVYLLEMFLHKPTQIEVGALGKIAFPQGYYYYAGSAQKNLKSRIERHYDLNKNKHWHIDYLLEEGYLKRDFNWELGKMGECLLTEFLKKELGGETPIPDFGSSDCDCNSHLIYFSQPINEEKLPSTSYLKKEF